MINLLLSFFASITLIIGIISMLTPIPGGTLMIAGSLTVLICSSPRAQSGVRRLRERINWFNKAIFWLEGKVGTRIPVMGNALKKTRSAPTKDLNENPMSNGFETKR